MAKYIKKSGRTFSYKKMKKYTNINLDIKSRRKGFFFIINLTIYRKQNDFF